MTPCLLRRVGANLRSTLPAVRHARGWTQDELAERANLRRTEISAIENGRIEVGRLRLERLAAALEVSVLELAPEAEADAPGLTLLRRLEAAEAALNALGPELDRLGRRVAALERQARTRTKRATA